MTRTPAKPRKPAIPAAPTWMNPAQKRAFSDLLQLEIGWKGIVLDSEKELFGDFVCLRFRLDGLRKLMRAAFRKKDAVQALTLNSQINATIAAAQKLADRLRLGDKEKAVMENR
ncbi:hypothetical protein NKI51_10760 [Mesorhizobium australicum]|uniref:hypothetical protein n=1 Tax=Mesorhizobium australicum TaxID=536018 RepID=UPI003337E18F